MNRFGESLSFRTEHVSEERNYPVK